MVGKSHSSSIGESRRDDRLNDFISSLTSVRTFDTKSSPRQMNLATFRYRRGLRGCVRAAANFRTRFIRKISYVENIKKNVIHAVQYLYINFVITQFLFRLALPRSALILSYFIPILSASSRNDLRNLCRHRLSRFPDAQLGDARGGVGRDTTRLS